MPPPEPDGTDQAYAAGSAGVAVTAPATEAASSRTRLPERKTNRPAIAAAMTTPTVGHSQVFQPEARRSRMIDQTAVTARPAVRAHVQRLSVRKARSSSTRPPPYSAAVPGARAVV